MGTKKSKTTCEVEDAADVLIAHGASTAVVDGVGNSLAYLAAKAGLLDLAKRLAREYSARDL